MPVQAGRAVKRVAAALGLAMLCTAAAPAPRSIDNRRIVEDFAHIFYAEKDVSEVLDNRRIVEDFAHIFYAEKDVRRAFATYVAVDYIQHNPGIADGREAAVAALVPMFSRPDARFDVKRILVDGDLAVIHLHGRGDASTAGAAVADIYRLKGGKIVEHWDIIQPMPTKSANPHPMF